MGMYTEVFARGSLGENPPMEVERILREMAGQDLDLDAQLPDHPLFLTPRWSHLGSSTSAYHPGAGGSALEWHGYDPRWLTFRLHGSLKNYDHEVEKFFDWIEPYIEAEPGEFIGYQLYEEHYEPTRYYKKDRA